MKILHLCYSDNHGGAAKAAFRLHDTLLKHGVDSNFLTCLPTKNSNKNVVNYSEGIYGKIRTKLYKIINLLTVRNLQFSKNPNLHTLDIFSVIDPEYLNQSDADIIHLHWVNFSMLSIKTISKIKKPIVWTFHDAWAIMGCEHHDDLELPNRYIEGYSSKNKNVKGIDLNKISWKLKKKYWCKLDFKIICPSSWLKNCVEVSKVLKDKQVYKIANIIDESVFKLGIKNANRKKHNLPKDKKLILFGALDINDKIKGGDLVQKALCKLQRNDIALIVFGSVTEIKTNNIDVHYTGYISNENKLAEIYSACDVMLVPSRHDNLPNTVLESMACGTPVVSFKIGGLSDMIKHKHNGYLAKAFDTEDFKNGINFILDNSENQDFKKNSIEYFNKNFNTQKIIDEHMSLYKKVLNQNH